MTYTNYSDNWSQALEVLADNWNQALEALASEHAQIQSDLSKCRCSKCDGEARRTRHRFGVVSDTHDYYGTIYRCNCLPVFWVINPETGDAFGGSLCEHRIEEVEA